MAFYMDEDDVWKCPKHTSKRRRTGICHVCLRERLSTLCPECANVRPCGCSAAATTTSSSSSSASYSSFSRFSNADSHASKIGIVGRVSNLIESEPSFGRSRSLALPFLRSKPATDQDCSNKDSPKTTKSFLSLFKSSSSSGNRSRRCDVEWKKVILEQEENSKKNEEDRRRMMQKSRSIAAVAVRLDSSGKSTKGKGWHFPSPIKAFKQSISKGIMVQERSPLYRG